MIESNIINWIDLGDSVEKMDIYGKKKLLFFFKIMHTLLKYNNFPTAFYYILHFMTIFQIIELTFFKEEIADNEYVLLIVKYFHNLAIIVPAVTTRKSLQAVVIATCIITLFLIACTIILCYQIYKEKKIASFYLKLANFIILVLMYYLVGPLYELHLNVLKCGGSKHQILEYSCYADIRHILLAIAAVINNIVLVASTCCFSYYFTLIGVVGKLDEKVRTTCNYETFLYMAKIIMFTLRFVSDAYGNDNEYLPLVLGIVAFVTSMFFCFYYYKYVFFYSERLQILLQMFWVLSTWFLLARILGTVLGLYVTSFSIFGWICLLVIILYLLEFNKEEIITNGRIFEVRSVKEIEQTKENLLELLDWTNKKQNTYLKGFIENLYEYLRDFPEMEEKFNKFQSDPFLLDKFNNRSTIALLSAINLVYTYLIEKSEDKVDITLNKCYFLINRMGNPSFAAYLCSSLKTENTKQLYYKFILMEDIKDYLMLKMSTVVYITSVRHVQMGTVILYHTYMDMLKVKIFDAVINQMDYFDCLKSTITNEKTSSNFLAYGENILKLRSDIFNIWQKITDLNPFSDECENSYMLYLKSILQDQGLAEKEHKKYRTMKNNKYHEKSNVSYQIFDQSNCAIILVDGFGSFGKVLYYTPNFPAFLKFNDKEVMNLSMDDFIPSVIKHFHFELIDDNLKFSNMHYTYREKRRVLISGKNNSLFDVYILVKCVPNLTYGMIFMIYLEKAEENKLLFVLDKELKFSGHTEVTKQGESFTISKDLGLTNSLFGHHIGICLPDILFHIHFENGKFFMPRTELELKGELYPVSSWVELEAKLKAVLNKIRQHGNLKNYMSYEAFDNNLNNNSIKEYDSLIKEIHTKYKEGYQVFYKIIPRTFLKNKYIYYHIQINFENFDNDVNDTGLEFIENARRSSIFNNFYHKKSQIKFHPSDSGDQVKKPKAKNEEENNEENKEQKIEGEEENIPQKKVRTNEHSSPIFNERKKLSKGKSLNSSSTNNTTTVEAARYQKLKSKIFEKEDPKNVKKMKILSLFFGVSTLGFIVFDSIRKKNNFDNMGEYLLQNLYINHTKISSIILYNAASNLYFIKAKYMPENNCFQASCKTTFKHIIKRSVDQLKSKRDNFGKFHQDFIDLMTNDSITVHTYKYLVNEPDPLNLKPQSLIDLIISYSLKVCENIELFMSGDENPGSIAHTNLIFHSEAYIKLKINGLTGQDLDNKLKEHFNLIPISLICVALIVIVIIVWFALLIYQNHNYEMYFLGKLLNFNNASFDEYLKLLDELKKKLRTESIEGEEKDEELEENNSKVEEDENKNDPKKSSKNQGKNKKKLSKHNKVVHQKQKKKEVMSLYFIKVNLFLAIKLGVVFVLSISYYVISMLVESSNKKTFLDFDDIYNSVSNVYKDTFDLYLQIKNEVNGYIRSIEEKKIAADLIRRGFGPFVIANGILVYTVEDIEKIPNRKMVIPEFGKQNIPRFQNYIVSIINDISDSEIKKGATARSRIYNLYYSNACLLLYPGNGSDTKFCEMNYNILLKGIEQSLVNLGTFLSTVYDEMAKINNGYRPINESLGYNDAIFNFAFFVEFYFYEAFLKSSQLFNELQEIYIKDIKNNCNVLLFLYVGGCIIIICALNYFLYIFKTAFNSFFYFIGIFPVKFLVEDERLYRDIVTLEGKIF